MGRQREERAGEGSEEKGGETGAHAANLARSVLSVSVLLSVELR